MKNICYHCLKKFPEAEDHCAHCNETNPETVDELTVRSAVQRLHKRANVYRERISAGLSFLVIGLTALIIGAIFLRLSYKLDQSNTEEIIFVLVPTSAEFVVSMICLIGGGISTLYGLVWSIVWSSLRRVIYHDIDEMRATNSLQVSRTPTVFEVAWQKMVYFFRQTAFVLRGRKAKCADSKQTDA